MDIHPPEHPIRSVRDFLLQIFTITCGILIALGLEQVVEWRRDTAIAAHARAQIIDEIDTNRQKIREVLAGESKLDAALVAWISYGEARSDRKPANPPPLSGLVERKFVHLSSSAWDAAVATRAVSYLRFAETHTLLEAYNKQQGVNELASRGLEQWVGLAGVGDPAKVTDSAVPQTLATLRIAFAYARSIAGNADLLLKDYDTAEAELKRGQE